MILTDDFDGNEDYGQVGEEYDRRVFTYGQAYGCGRSTFQYFDLDVDFSKYRGRPVSYEDKVILPEKGQFLCVAFDRFGKLRWKNNIMAYAGHESLILEVLTEKVSPEHLGYLDELGIPYLFAGKEEFEPELFLQKLKTLYHVDTFALCGGAEINAVFMRENLVDEISLVIGPAVDGSRDGLTFVGTKEREGFPCYFCLKEAEVIGNHGVVLHYVKNGPQE